jgi:hypothetical protein
MRNAGLTLSCFGADLGEGFLESETRSVADFRLAVFEKWLLVIEGPGQMERMAGGDDSPTAAPPAAQGDLRLRST